DPRRMHTFPSLRWPALALMLVAATAAAAAQPEVPAASAVTADAPEPVPALQPFIATYEAWNGGKRAGSASMQLERVAGHWRIDLDVTGDRGLARWVRLDIDQGTVFDEIGGAYRPLRQDTRR